jgi:sec-independent protein translocase protein TatA
MFDSKILLIILAIALVLFGAKRIRTLGSDLGAAVKGFKHSMDDGESEEGLKNRAALGSGDDDSKVSDRS